MDLNLLIMKDYLTERHIKAESRISDPPLKFSKIRIRPDKGSMEENTLYVEPGNTAYEDREGSLLRCKDDRIFLPGINLFESVNVVHECFESYSQWLKTLEESIDCKEPLQCLVDACKPVLPYPIAVVRPDTKLLTASSHVQDLSMYPVLQNLIQTGYMSMEDNLFFANDANAFVFLASHEPQLALNADGTRALKANLLVKGQREGIVFAFEGKNGFRDCDIFLLEILQKYLEKCLLRYQGLYISDSVLGTFLKNSSINESLDKEELSYVLSIMDWSDEDYFLVMRMMYKHLSVTQPYAYLMRIGKQIQQKIGNCCCLFIHGELTAIFNCGKGIHSDKLLKHIREFPYLMSCYVGCSFPFRGLEDFLPFYKQAGIALGYAQEQTENFSIISAEQIMLKQIENTTRDTDLQYWIHPDILHLSEMDRKYPTDNLYTLFIFLLCAGNLTDAAIIMGLHRNTVKYRISKIREIISNDIDSPSSRLILLSSMLLHGLSSFWDNNI